MLGFARYTLKLASKQSRQHKRREDGPSPEPPSARENAFVLTIPKSMKTRFMAINQESDPLPIYSILIPRYSSLFFFSPFLLLTSSCCSLKETLTPLPLIEKKNPLFSSHFPYSPAWTKPSQSLKKENKKDRPRLKEQDRKSQGR